MGVAVSLSVLNRKPMLTSLLPTQRQTRDAVMEMGRHK